MKKRHHRGARRDTKFCVSLLLDAPADAAGLEDGLRFDSAGDYAEKNSRRASRRATGASFRFTVRNTVPSDGQPVRCLCELTAHDDLYRWENLSQGDYFRYTDALARQYLSVVEKRLGADILPHVAQVCIKTPLTDMTDDCRSEKIRRNAEKLFPAVQTMRIADAASYNGVTVLTLQKTDGFTAAPFRSGQFLPLKRPDAPDQSPEPFLFCSSAATAREGCYVVAAVSQHGGASERWDRGAVVEASAPQGPFYYEPLRDKSTVVGLTDEQGAFTFLSMAKSIRDDAERFKLTVLYFAPEREGFPFRREFEQLSADCGKVRLICLEQPDGSFSAASLRPYLPHEAFSVFICGSDGFCGMAQKTAADLHLPEKNVLCQALGEKSAEAILYSYGNR